MHKKGSRRLTLHRETLRQLQLHWVKGGESTLCLTESHPECSYGVDCDFPVIDQSCPFFSCENLD